MANWLIQRTRLEPLLNRRSNVTESIKALYTTTKTEVLQRLFWCSRISLVIAIVLLFNLLSLSSQIMNGSNPDLINGKYLLRPGYGDGNKEIDLNVILEQTGDSNAADDPEQTKSQDISIVVEERAYTENELEIIFEKAFQYLDTKVLGDNKSSEQIIHNLHFCRTIPGTSITVDWQPDNYNLIQSDGVINNEELEEEGIATTVTAILTYQDQQRRYSMSFKIMPIQFSKEDILRNLLEKELKSASDMSADEEFFELPDTLDNYHLSWQGKKEDSSVTIIFLGVIMALATWLFGNKELENKMKKRKDQMLLDYPELINKFTLLVNAGMTIKQAWNKITQDYGEKSAQEKGNKRYAYEEMLTTSNELKLGVPENIAYEQYGKRIGLIPYIKFSSLITQNLKKGNRGFTDLMMKEAVEAFENRKEIAKRLGEEAGTKLLIPMILMLIMVFMIIMIPAFWAFGM